MRLHEIPPNYDSSKFRILGFVKITAVLESFVCAYILYSLLNFVIPATFFSPTRDLIIIALSVLVFFMLVILLNEFSLFMYLGSVVDFLTKRRSLKYRAVKKRIKVEEAALPELVKKTGLGLKKNTQSYTQEIFDIEKIEDGIIYFKDGTLGKVLEVNAANFLNMKEQEKNAVIADFGRFLKIGPGYVQLKTVSKTSDLSFYINYLKNFKNGGNLTDYLIDDVCGQLKDLSRGTALEHRYFLIFTVKPKNNRPQIEALNEVQNNVEVVLNNISRRGVRVNILNPVEEDAFLYTLFYEFFNRKTVEKISYREHSKKVFLDKKELGAQVRPADLIAPRSIDLKRPDFITMDGLYYSFFVLTDYPKNGVRTGWLGDFSNIGEGFDFDVLIRRENKGDIRRRLTRRNIFTKANMDQMNPLSLSLAETRRVARETEYLKQKLEGDSDFFYFNVIVTVVSESYDDLVRKKKWFKDLMEGYNFKVTEPTFEMEEAFLSTFPFAKERTAFFNKYRRNILSDGLEGFYPFTTASVKELGGIPLGINLDNRTPVILDIFNPVSNIFVFGMTGFGKSFLSMLIATRLRLVDIQVFVIAPIKGHEYKKISESVGGQYIKIGPGSPNVINILEIRPVLKVETHGMDDETTQVSVSYLNEKIQFLLKFFDLITKNTMSRTQQDLLNPFLIGFYRKFGITSRNNSIFVDGDPSQGLKEMPTITDLKKELEESENEELVKLAVPLKKFTDGNLNYFNGETNVDLDNKFCVIDLSLALEYEETRDLALFVVQDFIWSKVRSDRVTKKAILYEEIWKLLDHKESAELVREIFKTIRGYYGIAIGITQNLEDLTKNPYNIADGILNNTLIQILMHNTPDEAEKLQNRFYLTDYEYGLITGAGMGDALILTPSQHYRTKIMATQTESRLFETDGNKLNR